jgi:hypothetical protein
MLGMVIWLTASVFLISAIAYLHWSFYRIDEPSRWRWLYSQSARTTLAEPYLSWCRRLLTFVVGACFSAFWFAGTLHSHLSPPERPIAPEASLGFTHYFSTKHGGVYGTYFEYLTVNYGIWVMGAGMLLAGLIAIRLKINLYQVSPAYPLLVFVGAATSMVLCFTLWQICLHSARF